MKKLNPLPDLIFKTNSKVKGVDTELKNTKKTGGHLHKSDGKEVLDSEISSFSKKGMHVHCKSNKVIQKLESMANAIIQEDWIDFMTFSHELKKLNPINGCLDNFGFEQMKILFERNPLASDISVLRRKLGSIGVSDTAIEKGFEEGRKIMKAQQSAEKKLKKKFGNKN